jgi:hypothetical protein
MYCEVRQVCTGVLFCEHTRNILTFNTVIHLASWISSAAKHAYVSILFQFASLG